MKNTTEITNCAGYVNLISGAALNGSKISGLSTREKDSTRAWRWSTGKEVVYTFKSEPELQKRLVLKFTSPFSRQKISVKINGQLADSLSHLQQNVSFQKSYDFKSCSENTILIEFAVSSKDIGAFPQDGRDLSAMFYEFSVTSPCLSVARNVDVKFMGMPYENALLAKEEYAEGRTVLQSFPPIVTLALTTFCNNKLPCLICDRHTRHGSDCEVTEEIITVLEPVLKTALYVLLHCGGEAMYSKYFDKMLSIIEPPTRISFATNADLMSPRRVDLMLERDIMAGIVVSLDAATPEMYRIMRPSGHFDNILKNIKYYTQKAKELGRVNSTVTLNMTVCETNVEDVPKLVDLAIEVGAIGVDFNHLNAGNFHKVVTVDGAEWDYIEQSQFNNPERHDELIIEAYQKAKANNIHIMFVGKPFLCTEYNGSAIERELLETVAFQETEEDVWRSSLHKMLAPDVPSCFKPWKETVIQPDGDIRVCYFHEQGEWAVSNILHTKDFMKIWNSEAMVTERALFLKSCFSQRCIASAPCLHRKRK